MTTPATRTGDAAFLRKSDEAVRLQDQIEDEVEAICANRRLLCEVLTEFLAGHETDPYAAKALEAFVYSRPEFLVILNQVVEQYAAREVRRRA